MGKLGAAIWGAGNVSTEHLRAYVKNPELHRGTERRSIVR
jgi:hypothetical protein